MAITSVPIRATITLGNIIVKTPYILSFNVRRVRNSKATFSASLKIPAEELSDLIGNEVTIEAGTKSKQKKVFTGYVLSSRPSNCFDDPNYVILNVSGADAIFKLEGQFFTRRLKTSKQRWGMIEGVTRAAGKGSQFQLTNEQIQIVDEDIRGKLETDNQNAVTASLETLGNETLRPETLFANFKVGPVKYIEDE